MQIQKFLAKPISYSPVVRNLTDIEYIVIHNTGNDKDRAISNCKYFATTNQRAAGANFFIDNQGEVWQSIEMNRAAYAVGGPMYRNNYSNGGKYYRICTNSNSISIELCDIVSRMPSEAMIIATKELVKEIQTWCPNAKTIIRHLDVNKKPCPIAMVDDEIWEKFRSQIDPSLDCPYGEELLPLSMVTLKESYLRTSPEVKANKVAYSSLSSTLKKKCRKDEKGYAVFKIGKIYNRIRTYKDGENKWHQIQSKYWLPVIYDGVKRAKEK